MDTVDNKIFANLQVEYEEAKRRFEEWEPKQQQAMIIFAGTVKKYADMVYGALQKSDEIIDINRIIHEKRRLPDQMRSQAMRELKLRSAQSVANRVNRCRIFELTFPKDSQAYIYSCIKLSGQPRILLNDAQSAIVVGAYLFANWEAVLPGGQTKRTRERVQFKFIYDMFRQLFPDAQHRGRLITQDFLENFIRQEKAKDPVLFEMGRKGARKIWEKWMPKFPSTIKAPNECWIADARVLPFYIKHKGKRSTVTLLIIIDAFTGFIIAQSLIVRSVKDDSGEVHRVDFTADDVRLLLLCAMVEYRIRPKIWYTDNAAQFKALEPFLPFLAQSEGDEIQTVFGFPGHPWGRGEVEVTLREFDKAILKYSGIVRDENDLDEWRHARKSANFKLAELQSVVDKHRKDWNTGHTENKSSRHYLFENAKPIRLPIPSFDRLLYLGCASVIGTARISGGGISIPRRGKFRPTSIDDLNTWVDAASHGSVLYAIIPLNNEEKIYACLDGKTWEPLISIEAEIPSRQQRTELQWAVIRHRREQLAKVRRKFIEELDKLQREVPKISDDDRAIFIEIVASEELASAQDETKSSDSATSDTNKASKSRRKTSSKKDSTNSNQASSILDELQALEEQFQGIDVQEKANQRRAGIR